jgi:hypothetical protein
MVDRQICPLLSSQERNVQCLRSECSWWVAERGRRGSGNCAVALAIQNLESLERRLGLHLANVARAIGKK